MVVTVLLYPELHTHDVPLGVELGGHEVCACTNPAAHQERMHTSISACVPHTRAILCKVGIFEGMSREHSACVYVCAHVLVGSVLPSSATANTSYVAPHVPELLTYVYNEYTHW